jgi:hypothetical protein
MDPSQKSWALRQLLFSEVVRRLDHHFTELNVRYMPIKGAYLILSGCAEKMKRRDMHDIDILVRESDLQKASDYFFACAGIVPLTYFKDNYRPYETSFNYMVNEAAVRVELHSRLNFPQRFTLETAALFSRGRPTSGLMLLPSAEDSLIIFLCHLFTHLPLEWRETTWEEMALLYGQAGFSWDVFWKSAGGTGLKSFMTFMLHLCGAGQETLAGAGRPSPYITALSRLIGRDTLPRMPRPLRRLLLEIPFVKNPVWLALNKCEARRGNKERNQ